MAARVQMDVLSSSVPLDGESRLTLRLSAADYTGDKRVFFRIRIGLGSAGWEYPDLCEGGLFAFVPDVGLLTGMPDSKTAQAEVIVSMEDPAGNALGAPATAMAVFTAPEELCAPVLSEGWAVIAPYNGNTPYPPDIYVKGSRLLAVFDPEKITYRHGAGPADPASGRWRVSAGGNSAATDGIINTGDGLAVTVPESGSVEVTCRATDSRGFSASETFTITACGYAPPALRDVEIARCDASGAADASGAYIRVKVTADVSDLAGANSLESLRAEYASVSGESGEGADLESGIAALLGGGLSPANSYRVTVTARDSCMGSAAYTALIPTANAAFNIMPGGKGAAFGKYAEREGALDAGDWDIVTAGSIAAANFYPVGSVYLTTDTQTPAPLLGGVWTPLETGLPCEAWLRTE